MSQVEFESAFDYLSKRNLESDFQLISREKLETFGDNISTSADGVGFIQVVGPTLYSKMDAEPLCGPQMASYQRIEQQFDMFVDMGIKTLVLDIDSPGGEAYGAFETSKYMRKKADTSGIHIIAYVDGLAASAGYAFASAAHTIVMNPFSKVGSIGVVVRLQNINKMKKNMGVEETYIYAGDSKVPFNADGSFQKEFLEDIQKDVYELYDQFVEHVASLRPLSEAEVRDTQAKTFNATLSKEMGLADEVLTRDEFLSSYLPSVVENKGTTMLTKEIKTETKEFQENMSEISEVDKVAMEKLTAELAEARKAVAELKEEKHQAKLSDLTASLSELSFVGDSKVLAGVLIGMDAEASEAVVSTLKAAEAKLAEVETKLADAQAEVEKDLFVKQSVEGDSTAELSKKDVEKEKVNAHIKSKKAK